MTKEIKDNEIESSHASKRKETDSPRDLEKQEIPMRSQAESSRITLTTKEEDENEIKSTDDETETDLELKGMGIDHGKMKRHSSGDSSSTSAYDEEEERNAESHVFKGKEIDLLSDLEKTPIASSYNLQARADYESSSLCAKIQKVPDNMRLEGCPDYYTPSVISVGPIHGTTVKLAQRDLKLLAAAKFVVNTKGSMKHLLFLIKGDLDAIKKCYKETVLEPFSDDELASLFFLDACFVMQFIHSTDKWTLNEFGINRGLQNCIQQDLFLFENQLPWRLLKILIKFGKVMHLKEHICSFMAYNLISSVGHYLKGQYLTSMNKCLSLVKKEEPAHLLDLLRKAILYPLTVDHGKIWGEFLLEWLRILEWPIILERPRSFGNVQDLKTAGIKIKPSSSSILCDVSFSEQWFFKATLRVPALIVDHSTMSKLLNLAAYEMCPGNEGCDFGVSSYLSLMDSLVDTGQDVRDLRETRVLRNRFGSDEEVARLFNKIGSKLVVRTNADGCVQEQIQEHYERKLARWWAQFYEDYFSSPWKVLALMVGALVLFFSGISAYFAAFPPQHGK